MRIKDPYNTKAKWKQFYKEHPNGFLIMGYGNSKDECLYVAITNKFDRDELEHSCADLLDHLKDRFIKDENINKKTNNQEIHNKPI